MIITPQGPPFAKYLFVSVYINDECSTVVTAANKCEIPGAECKDNECICKAGYTENADATNCDQGLWTIASNFITMTLIF
jgi:hypothetical protein